MAPGSNGPRFALERAFVRHWFEDNGERERASPVIDNLARFAMRTLNDPRVFTNYLPSSNNTRAFGVDTQADPAVRKAGRHAVAVVFESDQARRGHPFAVLYDAAKRRWERH